MLNQLLVFSCLFSLALPLNADPLPTPSSVTPQPTLDMLPLKKALAPLYGNNAIQTHTNIYLSGSGQKAPFSFHEELRITARRPSCFHAELTQFSAQGTPKKRTALISNGVSVWIYQPSVHKYAEMTSQQFRLEQSSMPPLGLIVGGLYLGKAQAMVQGFRAITSSNSADIVTALSGMNIELTRDIKSVSNQDDYVYSMTLSKQNLAYKFYVNSATNTLTRVDLSGLRNGLQVNFREDIAQLGTQPAETKQAFVFTPPPGTSKAAASSLRPF